jgi:ABC-type Fe3+-siderophore transport system permease subunit
MIEKILEYVKPELLVLAFVLYFVGMALKKSETVEDRFIPLILGFIGIILAIIYVLAESPISGVQAVLMALFTGIVQGVLCAGLSTYVNQLIKQLSSKNEKE